MIAEVDYMAFISIERGSHVSDQVPRIARSFLIDWRSYGVATLPTSFEPSA